MQIAPSATPAAARPVAPARPGRGHTAGLHAALLRVRRAIASSSSWAIGAVMASAPALAQPPGAADATDAARPTRNDVEAACPAMVDTLQRELASSVVMQGKKGTVHVQFLWQDGSVRGVIASGGPAEYRHPIRRALHGISCGGGMDGDRFAFAIRFDPEADRDSAPAMPERLAQRPAP